jgi:hypothetical protein
MNRTALKAATGIALAFVLLAFAPKAGTAAESVEQVAVEELVAGINSARVANDSTALEALLSTALSPAARAAIVGSEQALCAVARQTLSEVTVPHLNIRAVRPITADVLEVDAVNVQFGSLTMRRERNVLLILKKEGSGWRVTAIQNFGSSGIIG